VIEIQRALLSVYDKRGIVEFGRVLHGLGIEMLSTGGTARALKEAGLPVTALEQVTALPELFEGRVKTLTPQVHGGLLMRRDVAEDRKQAEQYGIAPIDLLCVNLYPFADTVASKADDRAACVEMIDIGGPAMIRAASKNHRHVVVVTAPEQYDGVATQLRARSGGFAERDAAQLAAEAFALTGAYDGTISRYLWTGDEMPRRWACGGSLLQSVRYGENPHQRASCYVDGTGFWSQMKQLQGKELSYNNLGDLWAAWGCLQEFSDCACVVIKHGTPCGVALGRAPAEAFQRARDGDALSAFGGVVLLNRPADEEVARLLAEMFLEVVGAPEWDAGASRVLAKKKKLRVLTLPEGGPGGRQPGDTWAFRSLGEALLVQSRMPAHGGCGGWRCVTEREPSAAELAELEFAWQVVRHVRSNAIVFSREGQTIGIGCGQTSRIDACDVALMKAARAEHSTAGSVLASDAFFPFRDVVDRAAQAGARAIVEPGGSLRDKESIAACNEHGITMLFTGERVFMH
jgi:phosphoribosylaminoimidazolecarboxamide formyltransferase/IMP cyclohydrolase